MINKPEDFGNEILEEVELKINVKSEMTKSERQFLNGIIRQIKPKKIVEIGVAAGSSSVIILNAIKDIEGAKLYSLDYSTEYYRDNSKNTGFIVDEFPELKDKWVLKTGGMSCNFLDEIGGEIDVCLLDTMHSNPGEFLDYLQILPYMKKGGIVILHDTCLHTFSGYLHQSTCCTLLSAVKGQKMIPQKTEYKFFPNIGAVILDDDAKERVFDVFNCLALPWAYLLEKKDIKDLKKHFSNNYSTELVDIFIKACALSVKQSKGKAQVQNSLDDISPCGVIDKISKTIKLCSKNW